MPKKVTTCGMKDLQRGVVLAVLSVLAEQREQFAGPQERVFFFVSHLVGGAFRSFVLEGVARGRGSDQRVVQHRLPIAVCLAAHLGAEGFK